MEYWIWLSILKGVGPIIQKRLLDYFKDAESVYNASKSELMEVPGIGDSTSEVIKYTSLDDGCKLEDVIFMYYIFFISFFIALCKKTTNYDER